MRVHGSGSCGDSTGTGVINSKIPQTRELSTRRMGQRGAEPDHRVDEQSVRPVGVRRRAESPRAHCLEGGAIEPRLDADNSMGKYFAAPIQLDLD